MEGKDATIAQGIGFGRCPQPTAAFIQKETYVVILILNLLDNKLIGI